jgi:hypothetical protein
LMLWREQLWMHWQACKVSYVGDQNFSRPWSMQLSGGKDFTSFIKPENLFHD